MDFESRLRIDRDLPAVKEFLDASGGRLERRDQDPDGLYWIVLGLDTGQPFVVRVFWSVYPFRPPSVLFAESIGGSTTVPSAWPNATGYRAPNDICKPFSAEGQQIHPEWAGSVHAWRPEGNPFLYVVETIDADVRRVNGARAA